MTEAAVACQSGRPPASHLKPAGDDRSTAARRLFFPLAIEDARDRRNLRLGNASLE